MAAAWWWIHTYSDFFYIAAILQSQVISWRFLLLVSIVITFIIGTSSSLLDNQSVFLQLKRNILEMFGSVGWTRSSVFTPIGSHCSESLHICINFSWLWSIPGHTHICYCLCHRKSPALIKNSRSLATLLLGVVVCMDAACQMFNLSYSRSSEH